MKRLWRLVGLAGVAAGVLLAGWTWLLISLGIIAFLAALVVIVGWRFAAAAAADLYEDGW